MKTFYYVTEDFQIAKITITNCHRVGFISPYKADAKQQKKVIDPETRKKANIKAAKESIRVATKDIAELEQRINHYKKYLKNATAK